ncbi:MAG TPA: M81 family metallopeptidase [Chloroflexota bacterium]|nr:M81 family metallopeptidase [Chloroflexota bacterium]
MTAAHRPRIAALGLHHETNTFSSFPTTYASFSTSSYGGVLRGEQIERNQRSSHSTFAGYFQAADDLDFELVPLLFAVNDPCGTIERHAFDEIVGEMMQLLEQRGPWDGVLLNQMGAAVSEEYPDVDGEVASRTRAIVGPDVPVVMTLDLHANISRKMAEFTEAIVVYRTNPHMDAKERAVEACDILVRTIRGEIHPVAALEMPPMVISILRQDTREEPMRGVIADVEEAATLPRIIHTSMAEGYPWADVEEMGAAFYAVADGDLAAARAAARWMAERAWSRRADLATAPGLSPRAALEHARRAPKGPVVLLDVGDNVGAGSAGDSTFILAEAQRLGVRSLLETFRDPEAVAACVAAGAGATVTLTLGGKTDALHGAPVTVTGTVGRISDGRFEEPEPIHGGFRFFNNGPSVVLETVDGHTLLLVTNRYLNTSRQQYYSVGVRPEEFKLVVAKGVVSPRPAYQPIAAEMLLVNTGGAASADLSTFKYRRRRRPLYPFEPDAAYP